MVLMDRLCQTPLAKVKIFLANRGCIQCRPTAFVMEPYRGGSKAHVALIVQGKPGMKSQPRWHRLRIDVAQLEVEHNFSVIQCDRLFASV